MTKNQTYRLVSLVHCADRGGNDPWRWWKALQAETVVCCAAGNQCRAGQSLQQQAEEAVEAVEICRMLRKEGKWDGRIGSKAHQVKRICNGFTGDQVEQRNTKTIVEDIWNVLLSSSDINDLVKVLNIIICVTYTFKRSQLSSKY